MYTWKMLKKYYWKYQFQYQKYINSSKCQKNGVNYKNFSLALHSLITVLNWIGTNSLLRITIH